MKQVRGGLTFREGHYICETICETGLLIALDMMVIPCFHVDILVANLHDFLAVGGQSITC